MELEALVQRRLVPSVDEARQPVHAGTQGGHKDERNCYVEAEVAVNE